MRHFLPAIGVAVEDQPIAALGEADVAGDPVGGQDHLRDQGLISVSEVRNGLDMSLGDDLNVLGRLWADVAEGYEVVILSDFGGRNLAGDDAAEDAVGQCVTLDL